MKIHIKAVLFRIDFLEPWAGLGWPGLGWPGLAWAGLSWPGLVWASLNWPGLAWAGLGAPKWSPGRSCRLKVKIHIIAVLFRIDFLEPWAGLGWPGLA